MGWKEWEGKGERGDGGGEIEESEQAREVASLAEERGEEGQ